MKTRIITAAVGISFVILLMIFGEMLPILFSIAIALANTIASLEFLTAKKLQKNPLIMVTTVLFSLAMPMMATTDFWYVPLYLYTLCMFLYMMILRGSYTIKDICFGFSGVFVIGGGFSLMSRIVVCSQGWPSFFFVMAVISPWCADSAAYFVGSFMGKTKLCPSVSPNKTVEGAVGGVIGSIAGTLIGGLVFQFIVYRNVTVNYGALILIGIFCAVVSVLGDLIFSVIKRDCGIKDYGSIMPGHGGMLDRVDSVLFCVPFTYLISDSMGLLIA